MTLLVAPSSSGAKLAGPLTTWEQWLEKTGWPNKLSDPPILREEEA
jgi:hypothetical protein